MGPCIAHCRAAADMRQRPLSASAHAFASALGRHVLVVDRSRIYDLEAGAVPEAADLALLVDGLLAEAPPAIDGTPLDPPPLQSLSLNVAQACNMSCGYCYADAGRFGGRAAMMRPDVARASVDRLIAEAAPGADLLLGFMGGEPFLNRRLIHEVVPYAADAARRTGRRMRFSLTTNATLIEADDAALLARFPFCVAVSLDGPPRVNDCQRRLLRGGSAYGAVLRSLDLFAKHGRPRHLSVRVTVTPDSGALVPILDH